MAYTDFSTRTQVRHLRDHALAVLRDYPVEVSGVRLLYHGFNTTFRVDTLDGRRFALRINVNSQRTIGQITAEQAWLRAIAADTTVKVPVPQPARDGRFIVEARFAPLGRDLPAVLYSWLPGRNVGDAPTLTQMRAVGAAMAQLHNHAEMWRLPKGAVLTTFDDTLFGQPEGLSSSEHTNHHQRSVFAEALAVTRAHLADLYATSTPIVSHQDMHNSNVRWHDGQLAVFDFDDSGIALPVQDLATAVYYTRDDMRLERALFEGYEAHRPLPTFTAEQFESLIAGRNLLLANDLLTTTTADLLEMLPGYLKRSAIKLRRWLDTGQYRHDVE